MKKIVCSIKLPKNLKITPRECKIYKIGFLRGSIEGKRIEKERNSEMTGIERYRRSKSNPRMLLRDKKGRFVIR